MHPVLFTISLFGHTIPFYTYGFFLGWAFFASAHTGAHFGQLDGNDRGKMLRFAAAVIACGFFGGHLHWILTQPPEKRDFSTMFALRFDGFTFYGAVISGVLSGIPIARWMKIEDRPMSDAAAVSIAIAHGIGRIGCFFRGCDYGVLATGKLAWMGVSFPRGDPGVEAPAWVDQVNAHLITPDAPCSLPVVPTQLIEVVVELSLAGALWWYLSRKQRPRAGSAFLIYGLVYGLLRAGEEQLRGDADRGTMFGVSTSTAIGLMTAVGALIFLTVPPLVRLRPPRPPWPEPAPDAPLAQKPANS